VLPCWLPVGDRMLFTCSPSGNEELFVEMGRLGPAAPPSATMELSRLRPWAVANGPPFAHMPSPLHKSASAVSH
jgi:hypothetical protein